MPAHGDGSGYTGCELPARQPIAMDTLFTSFDRFAPVLWAALLLAWVLLAAWLLTTHSRSRRLEARLDDLLGSADTDNVGHMLVEYLTTVRSTAAAVRRLHQDQERLAGVMPTTLRHVGLVRFSPFHDTGGDQSFTLAVLDGRCDGVVMTGLHSRTDSRLYAKPIQGGESEYTLIPEEREAISRALNRHREPTVSS